MTKFITISLDNSRTIGEEGTITTIKMTKTTQETTGEATLMTVMMETTGGRVIAMTMKTMTSKAAILVTRQSKTSSKRLTGTTVETCHAKRSTTFGTTTVLTSASGRS